MKVQNPIIGRSRGSAGGMTFSKNYDKNVARAKAFEVSNPKTASQQDQRNFFKEVAAIVATVSEEELRSLFGIKPKAMSRRNALSKQVATAYSIVDGQKVVDFSKLQAIGNGQKVTTPIVYTEDVSDENVVPINSSMFFVQDPSTATIVAVIFDVENKKIILENISLLVSDVQSMLELINQIEFSGVGYIYATCSSDGSNVSDKPFGSFLIKTRSVGKQVEPTPPALEVTIYSGGIDTGAFFHFDGGLFDHSNGDQPSLLLNGVTEICDTILWDEVNNWWYGYTNDDIDTSSPLTLSGTINGESVTDIPVDWVIQ